MTSAEHHGEDYARMLSAILQDGRNHAHHRFLAIKHRSKLKLLQKHVSVTFPRIDLYLYFYFFSNIGCGRSLTGG